MRRHWQVYQGLIAGAAALVLLLAGLPGVGAAPPAQQGTPLHYGDTVAGEVTEAVPCQYYWFEGAASDAVSLDMTRTSGSLDGVMSLFLRDDLNADPVAFSDDRPGGGLNPLIEVTLPAADWYTVAACRLENDNMRVTEGTFNLTLTGPAGGGAVQGAAPTPTSLTGEILPASPADSLDEASGAGAQPNANEQAAGAAEPGIEEGALPLAPSPTANSLTQGLFGGSQPTPTAAQIQPAALLADGQTVSGRLESGMAQITYPLEAHSGEEVVLDWQSSGGELAPLLAVLLPDGKLLAQAASPDVSANLQLVFAVPVDGTLTVVIARFDRVIDQTAGDFTLQVQVRAANQPGISMPTPAPTPTAAVAATAEATEGPAYLANACQAHGTAVPGPVSTATLTDVQTASGDGLTPEEVTPTDMMTPNDDLNVLLTNNSGQTITIAAVFCAPSGRVYDAGSGQAETGMTYLLGLDWEYERQPWETGRWTVEVYVNDALDATVPFEVAQG